MNVVNKTILLTGANGGLGCALIKSLLAAGAGRIYAACRDTSMLTESDPRVVPLTLDVTKRDSIESARDTVEGIDILINNAGCNRQRGFIDGHSPEAAEQEMAVNYFGVLKVSQAFIPQLRERQGAIINVLSILARVTLPAMGSLCASKAAALRLTEGLSAELQKSGVQVMAVLPGVIDTAMSRDFPGPKADPRDIAVAIVQGLEDGAKMLYPDVMAQEIAQSLSENRPRVVSEFAAYL